jgi:predicted PurR-regulated permease PerM
MPDPRRDLTRTTLAVLFIGALIAATFWILRPFLLATIWAITLVIATWPVMLWLQHRLGNRRGPAILLMSTALLVALVVPFALAVMTILNNINQISGLIRTVLSLRVPPPPDWVAQVPLIGPKIGTIWVELTSAGVRDLAPRLTPYAGQLTQWFAAAVGSLAGVFVQSVLTVIIAGALYARGEAAAGAAVHFGHRLAGDRGAMAVVLAGKAIRAVALGVVVTALAQSVLGGIGLALVGIPFAPMLTAVMFILCLAQIGPGLVLIPAVVWMFYASTDAGGFLGASLLLGFTVVCIVMESVLRPVLIRRGADIPLALVLMGVIGGLLWLGLLGIFLGPTVLAVTYTLVRAWIAEDDAPDPATAFVPEPAGPRVTGQPRLTLPRARET